LVINGDGTLMLFCGLWSQQGEHNELMLVAHLHHVSLQKLLMYSSQQKNWFY